MISDARETILTKLKSVEDVNTPERSEKIHQIPMEKDELVNKFTESLSALSGEVYIAENKSSALEKLADILERESISSVMTTEEDYINSLNLKSWGDSVKVKVTNRKDYNGRKEYKDALFEEMGAGITSADYAVAESGTLGVVFNPVHPRLISLAPIIHIAILPIGRIVPYYEDATKIVFKNNPPSQFTFITGPSLTADIMATSFTGMHGPGKVIVIFVE